MKIRTIGIDLWKTDVHLVGVNARGESGGSQDVLADAAAAICLEPLYVPDRHGGVRRFSFSGPGSAGTGA